MKITNSIKAIIIDGAKILCNKLIDENGNVFYTLPGGKQEPHELMLDALIRETKEETGYTVSPKSLLFIREGFKEESHRIEFMFVCDIVSEYEEDKLVRDNYQVGTKWLSIDNILHEDLRPAEMRNVIKRYFLGKPNDIYLGKME
jgi:ADP-ribose pyrophosphatase YjhB (NUDIX family)